MQRRTLASATTWMIQHCQYVTKANRWLKNWTMIRLWQATSSPAQNTSKSKGRDGIPAKVLRTYASEPFPILNQLFQLSYTLGTFPTSWKLPHSFPFLQKGEKPDLLNHCPIAIITTKQSRNFLAAKSFFLITCMFFEYSGLLVNFSLIPNTLVLCFRILLWEQSDLCRYFQGLWLLNYRVWSQTQTTKVDF